MLGGRGARSTSAQHGVGDDDVLCGSSGASKGSTEPELVLRMVRLAAAAAQLAAAAAEAERSISSARAAAARAESRKPLGGGYTPSAAE